MSEWVTWLEDLSVTVTVMSAITACNCLLLTGHIRREWSVLCPCPSHIRSYTHYWFQSYGLGSFHGQTRTSTMVKKREMEKNGKRCIKCVKSMKNKINTPIITFLVKHTMDAELLAHRLFKNKSIQKIMITVSELSDCSRLLKCTTINRQIIVDMHTLCNKYKLH